MKYGWVTLAAVVIVVLGFALLPLAGLFAEAGRECGVVEGK